MFKFRFMVVFTSLLMLTACASDVEDSSAVTVQSESSSVIIQVIAAILPSRLLSRRWQLPNNKKKTRLTVCRSL